MQNRWKLQNGFGLIEVLVAAFIIAVGVLGVTSAQMLSLKNNQSAYFRSQANFLVLDMLDRIRANIAGMANTANPGTGIGLYSLQNTSGGGTLPVCSGATGCSPSQIVERDLIEWASYFPKASNNNVGLIPGSTGSITSVRAPGLANAWDVTVTVMWEETWDQLGAATSHAAGGPIPDGMAGFSLTTRIIAPGV